MMLIFWIYTGCNIVIVNQRCFQLFQISMMQKKLKQWCLDVNSIEQLVEVKAEDILA